jgi:hypothetical protein
MSAVELGPPAHGQAAGAACEASDRARFKRALSLTGGPQRFIYLSRFSNTHILIFELVTLLMSKIHQILYKDRERHKEQLSFLAQLQIPKGLQVINSGTKIKIETSSNFKGVQNFLEKSDKFYNILSSQS